MNSSREFEMKIRTAAQAGTFYPADPDVLADMVNGMLVPPVRVENRAVNPRALLVPHAGYMYSGPIAGAAYEALRSLQGKIRQVVIFGPAHYGPLLGMALPGADFMETPLGKVPVNDSWRQEAVQLDQVGISDEVHHSEHSLETHLPFLQCVLGEFEILPVLVGHAESDTVHALMKMFWGREETLFILSTDFSHFLSYEQALVTDNQTVNSILNLNPFQIQDHQACGAYALRPFLKLAREENSRFS